MHRCGTSSPQKSLWLWGDNKPPPMVSGECCKFTGRVWGKAAVQIYFFAILGLDMVIGGDNSHFSGSLYIFETSHKNEASYCPKILLMHCLMFCSMCLRRCSEKLLHWYTNLKVLLFFILFVWIAEDFMYALWNKLYSSLTHCWLWPRAGSGVVRIDPLHFLAGYHKRQPNQALSCLIA